MNRPTPDEIMSIALIDYNRLKGDWTFDMLGGDLVDTWTGAHEVGYQAALDSPYVKWLEGNTRGMMGLLAIEDSDL